MQLPWLAALAGCDRPDAALEGTFTRLSPLEARTMRAFAAQIIPSGDGAPGADEAGAVFFIDRALGMPFFADRVPVIRAGLADLDARARTVDSRGGFAGLSSAQQQSMLRQIEHDQFFTIARTFVVMGTFADSSYGGNRANAGWMMVGMGHQPSYAAPFGWYDSNAAGDSALHAA